MATVFDEEGNAMEEFDEWEMQYQADLEAEADLDTQLDVDGQERADMCSSHYDLNEIGKRKLWQEEEAIHRSQNSPPSTNLPQSHEHENTPSFSRKRGLTELQQERCSTAGIMNSQRTEVLEALQTPYKKNKSTFGNNKESHRMGSTDFDESEAVGMDDVLDYELESELVSEPIELSPRKSTSIKQVPIAPQKETEFEDDLSDFELTTQDEGDDHLMKTSFFGAARRKKEQEGKAGITKNSRSAPDKHTWGSLLPRESDGYLLSRPERGVQTMTITLTDGQRYFVKLEENKKSSRSSVSRHESKRLLKTSVKEMLKTLEKNKEKQLYASIRDAQNHPEAAIEVEPQSATPTQRATLGVEPKKSTLWVDKYAPQKFMDLISDERTNREVLSWIKSWDPFVFKGQKQDSRLSGPERELQTSKGALSSDVRPRERVLLIAGPPGLGKTTLAHVCAKQAGYNVVEINASDDRTGSVLKQKIINATEMVTMFGNGKPNLLVLDEIDGAMSGGEGKSGISTLLEMIMAPLVSTTQEAGDNGQQKTKKKRSHHALLRPLICICNDQYAPVLRPLRKIAKIINCRQTNPQRLLQRLKTICSKEKVLVRPSALTALCASSEMDIRFCLNALQFVRNQGNKTRPIGVDELLGGHKSQSKSLFETWSMIFQHPRQIRRLGSTEDKDSENPSLRKSHTTVLYELVGGFADQGRILDGVHENFLRMRYSDHAMHKTVDCLDWMLFTDECLSRAKASQQWSMLKFAPASAVAVHRLCSIEGRSRIELPRRAAELVTKQTATHNIVWSFIEGTLAVLPGSRNVQNMLMDVIPFFLRIIAPPLRNVNLTVMTTTEKQTFYRVVDLVTTYGLTIDIQHDALLGTLTYKIDPAVDMIAVYGEGDEEDGENGGEGKPVFKLPMQMLQMIAHESELERMRRAEGVLASAEETESILSNNQEQRKKSSKPIQLGIDTSRKDVAIDEEKENQRAAAAANNFLRKKDTKRVSHADSISAGIRFKYLEGFTNAVKRPVKIFELV